MDRWRTGDVFGDEELPVLFAHGHHNQPDAMVLATTEYRRAYAGKLSGVLARMVDGWHLVWVGFSFADQRINAVLREVAEHSGTRVDPGGAPRHVAVMAWDPDIDEDPQTLRTLAEIDYGADLILYPAPGGITRRCSGCSATSSSTPTPRHLPLPAAEPSQRPDAGARVASAPATAAAATSPPALPVRWVPPVEPVEPFTGRVEELARLDRWAADPDGAAGGGDRLGWGGQDRAGDPLARPARRARGAAGAAGGVRVELLRRPLRRALGQGAAGVGRGRVWRAAVGRGRPAAAVLALLQAVPLVLVLDGLEVTQEGPEGAQFGRLLDGTLREVLTGACQIEHRGLVVLTSRFAFADLEGFDGGPARMLDVPPFTPAEGAALLAATGAGWLAEEGRRELVEGVDGHALAVAALGGVLADRPPAEDLEQLRAELAAAATTNTRVAKVLGFYADRLSEPDRYLVAAVGLFAHPVTPDAVLTVAGHASFGGRLDGWTAQQVQAAARERLAGLLSWHPDGTLVGPSAGARELPAAGAGRRRGRRRRHPQRCPGEDRQPGGWAAGGGGDRAAAGRRPVAGRRRPLPRPHRQRRDVEVAARGPAGAAGRVGVRGHPGPPAGLRRPADPNDLGFYLTAVGLCAKNAGDLVTAREYLDAAVRHYRDANDPGNLAIALRNLADCLGWLGEVEAARQAAAESATHAATIDDPVRSEYAAAFQGWVAMLAGDSRAAEEHFLAADRIEYANDPDNDHLYSLLGVWWGEFLARTGRPGPARRLTKRNREISTDQGWNEDVARCDRCSPAWTWPPGPHHRHVPGDRGRGHLPRRRLPGGAGRDLAGPGRGRPRRRGPGRRRPTRGRGLEHHRPPRPAACPRRGADGARPHLRRSGRRGQPRPAGPGPGRRRRRPADRDPPRAGLAGAGRPGRPRPPRPGRGRRPRLGASRRLRCGRGCSRPSWTPTRWPRWNAQVAEEDAGGLDDR